MHFEFVFPDETIILPIELVDNPGVLAWVDHFDGYQTHATIHDHLYVPEINVTNEDVYDLPRQRCLVALTALAEQNFVYTGPVPTAPEQVDANCLNQLHRYFTHQQQEVNNTIGRLSQKNQDPNKLIPGLVETEKLLQDLNTCVHDMEAYCKRAPANIAVSQIEEIKLYHPNDHGTAVWFNLEQYRQFHNAEHHDVILSSEVLGKTLLQSYIDQDDPADWDTSGHHSSAGGVQILLDQSRQMIYHSQDFQDWLRKHNADELYYDFPIGNVLDKSALERITQLLTHNRTNTYKVIYHK